MFKIYIYDKYKKVMKKKKVREKSRKCHNHEPQLFPDTEEEEIQIFGVVMVGE